MFIFMVFLVQLLQIAALVLCTAHVPSSACVRSFLGLTRATATVIRFLGRLRRSTEEETIVRVRRLEPDPDMVVRVVPPDDQDREDMRATPPRTPQAGPGGDSGAGVTV
jgi:hypothetical protein